MAIMPESYLDAIVSEALVFAETQPDPYIGPFPRMPEVLMTEKRAGTLLVPLYRIEPFWEAGFRYPLAPKIAIWCDDQGYDFPPVLITAIAKLQAQVFRTTNPEVERKS